MLETAFRNARIVTPAGIVEGDLGIREGRIDTVGQAGKARHEIDAAGRFLCPGGVTPMHIEQMSGMGQMNADTWETATRSAAMGGNHGDLLEGQAKASRLLLQWPITPPGLARRCVDHAFHAINKQQQLQSIWRGRLRQVIARPGYHHNIGLDDGQILSAMAAARAHGALVCIHAENDAIIARPGCSAGRGPGCPA